MNQIIRALQYVRLVRSEALWSTHRTWDSLLLEPIERFTDLMSSVLIIPYGEVNQLYRKAIKIFRVKSSPVFQL